MNQLTWTVGLLSLALHTGSAADWQEKPVFVSSCIYTNGTTNYLLLLKQTTFESLKWQHSVHFYSIVKQIVDAGRSKVEGPKEVWRDFSVTKGAPGAYENLYLRFIPDPEKQEVILLAGVSTTSRFSIRAIHVPINNTPTNQIPALEAFDSFVYPSYHIPGFVGGIYGRDWTLSECNIYRLEGFRDGRQLTVLGLRRSADCPPLQMNYDLDELEWKAVAPADVKNEYEPPRNHPNSLLKGLDPKTLSRFRLMTNNLAETEFHSPYPSFVTNDVLKKIYQKWYRSGFAYSVVTGLEQVRDGKHRPMQSEQAKFQGWYDGNAAGSKTSREKGQ